MYPLVDTHCHLDFDVYNDDREAVLGRARQAGIHRVLIPGIDLDTSQAAVNLAQTHESIFAAVGVHPNDGDTWIPDALAALRALAQQPKVVAIGEIGLDYYRDRVDRNRQKEIFLEQLELAAELNLPVIIHNRQASEDILPLLAAWVAKLRKSGSPLAARPGVLHAYDGNTATAQHAADLNFFMGIGGPVTFKNALERQSVVAQLPLNWILTETDGPFLTPHPFRGRRNEPAYIRQIAEKIAELQQTTLAVVAEATARNAARLFAWGDEIDKDV